MGQNGMKWYEVERKLVLVFGFFVKLVMSIDQYHISQWMVFRE
jgi:hypothetical protein